VALTFKKIAKLSTNELVLYYNASMQKQFEVADEYARNRKRNNDLQLRINPSSLPCCPILNTFHAVALLRATETTTGLGSGFGSTYSGLGSTRHEICQQFLGRAGRIYGDWHCPRCGSIRYASLYKQCSCGEFPLYREMRFTHEYNGRTVKSFKLDGIFKDSKGKLWVMDYKFVMPYRLMGKGLKELPTKKNRRQVLDYVHTLRLKGGKFSKIEGYILLYVAFDKVILEGGNGYHSVQRKVSQKATKRYAKYLNREYSNLLLARRAAKAVVGKELEKGTVKELVARKPCTDFDHYTATIHDQYNPCPYAEDGSCFKQGFVKRLHHDLKLLSAAQSS